MKKVLYIGNKATHDQYVKGIVPSHWLYGAIEMERCGCQMVWEDESPSLLNDCKLVRASRPDIVFIPNLNLHRHILLLVLSALGIQRKPVIAFLHHEPKVKKGVRSWLYRIALSGCRHIFFLSGKTMENTVNNRLVNPAKCSLPGWGADMDFYDKVTTSPGDYFVSTGKENRDFDILIEAFKKTGAPLKIITAKEHAGNNHEYLAQACKDIPNIEVILTENTGEVYGMMIDEMAHAKALVCPIRQDCLNYCVGLSTITDAEGLSKPLIITRNPYHDPHRTRGFNVVESLDDWVEAIKNLSSPPRPENTMERCWENMKAYIQ